jgi:salicylate hydroxylase
MGGLTCALALAKQGFTNIDVYELASNLGFVGAGIQLAPNMARILDRLGVWKDVEREAVVLNDTSIRGTYTSTYYHMVEIDQNIEGATDTELGRVELDYIKTTYGYAHMVGHRSSLAGALYEGCKREASIKFHFSSVVEKVTAYSLKPTFTVQPRDGSASYEVQADILLAADGVKSNTKIDMLKAIGADVGDVKDTGQAAYRIMLKREQMENDPELLALINSDRATRWVGEKRHIIAYPVSSKTIYNLSTTQPDTNFAAAPSETYTTKGSKSAMLGVFADFCPMVHRMLELVPEGEVCEWKLRVHAPLPTWVHGSLALVGDACHPTLPHLAQGAAQAIEDAAVLAVALGRLPDSSPASINKALRIYEKVRKQRAETLVEMAAASGRAMHLGEGKAKEERDRQFAALKNGTGPVPDKWADADVQKFIYGFDCDNATNETFSDEFAEL